MNTIDKQYQSLLQDILDNGVEKSDRTGTGTISVFGRQIRHKMSNGFPLLTTKKMAFKTMVTELIWFLRGDTNIKYLVDNGCNIWNGDAYKRYEKEFEKGKAPGETLLVQRVDGKSTERKLSMEKFIAMIQHDDEFAEKWGDLGPIYGKQWRSWTNYPSDVYVPDTIDQIANLINDLKTNPDSRRLMVNAWNVGELDNMVLPPCHYGFQVYTRELSAKERYDWYFSGKHGSAVKMISLIVNENENDNQHIHNWINTHASFTPKRAISLMWNQRSVDTPLGLPFNIASYALLLEIFAKMVNMVPDELIANLGDAHIYKNQIDGVKEQLIREPMKLPKIDIHPGILDYELDKLEVDMFKLVDYQSHSSIKMPLSN